MGLFNRDDGGRGFRNRYDRELSRSHEEGMWDRVERGFRGRDPNDVGMRGDGRTGRDFENRGTMDYGADYGMGGRSGGYGRDLSPTEAGWRAGGMGGGSNRGWNLGGGRMDLGHHWGAGGYDREMRGDDRNFMERTGESVRRGFNELTGGGYDRGYRGERGRGDYGADYGRGMHGADRDPGRYGQGVGYDPGFPRDRGGYDRHEYKSRQQTDTGDPFGDRQNRTPVRMVNEDYADRLARRNAYDADVRRDRDWF